MEEDNKINENKIEENLNFEQKTDSDIKAMVEPEIDKPLEKQKIDKPKEKQPKKQRKIDYWKISSLAFLLLVIISIFTHGFSSFDFTGSAVDMDESEYTDKVSGDESEYTGEKVKFDLYVMSQCPGGTQAENNVKPVLDKIGDAIEFSLNFVIYEDYCGYGKNPANCSDEDFKQYCIDDEQKICAMHGISEIKGDIVQLCAQKYNKEKFMDMVICMNKEAPSIPDNWEDCAKEVELDIDNIKTCYEGEEGLELLKQSKQASEDAGAMGSPTMFLNGEPFGERKTEKIMRTICNAINNKHSECENLPEPIKVELILINDKECKDCDTSEIMGVFKQMFEALEIKELDYEDKEAQELISENEIKLLPAFIFNSKIAETDAWKENQRMQAAFNKVGDNYIPIPESVGAKHDPLKEICDNGKDDRDNDTLVDCEDDECASKLICNKDALVECAEPYNITSDTIIFFYSNQCGWCAKMKPFVEKLQEENYSFYWAGVSNAEEMEVIEKCFREHMTSGGVPQFICLKNANIKVGAFTDADRNLDLEAMRKFADDCIAS